MSRVMQRKFFLIYAKSMFTSYGSADKLTGLCDMG